MRNEGRILRIFFSPRSEPLKQARPQLAIHSSKERYKPKAWELEKWRRESRRGSRSRHRQVRTQVVTDSLLFQQTKGRDQRGSDIAMQ